MENNMLCGYVFKGGDFHDGRQFFEASSENIANFIASNSEYKTVVTDLLDLFVASSLPGGFLDQVTHPSVRAAILSELLPIQMGEKEPYDPVALYKEQHPELF